MQSISVIIPAYNESARLPSTLDRLMGHLDAVLGPVWEVIVSDDGSDDDTLEIAQRRCDADPRISVVRRPDNTGKGAALVAGFDQAVGDIVIFMDADLPIPLESLEEFLTALGTADIVVGSRRLARSSFIEVQPRHRRWGASLFLAVVARLGLLPTTDPQCGVKAMRRDVVTGIIAETTNDGFAFDIELLLRARRAGISIHETPVRWSHVPGSSVRPLRDGVVTLAHLLRLRRSLGALTGGRPVPVAP